MKPNVLLIMIDSLRADRVWGAGRECQTPFLDNLRRRSTCLTRAFSTASITTTCTTSLLTGVYPLIHGVHTLARHRLRPDIPTLAELFQAHGYHTWAETTGPLRPVTGLDRGFDEYRCRKYTEWLDTPFGESMFARIHGGGPRPWFGFLHLWETHFPRRVTPEYNHARYGRNLYDRAVSSLDHQLGRLLGAGLPENTVVILTGDHGEYLSKSKGGKILEGLRGPFAWLKRRAPAVRKLKRFALKTLFRTKDTTERVSKRDQDSYWAWLGHGFHIFDPLVQVPLLMYGPGLFPESAEISHLVSHVDLLPTLASALGLQRTGPPAVSGIDLMPLLQTTSARTNGRAIYMEAADARMTAQPKPEQWLAGLRTDRYKYARGLFNEALEEELYDLEHDPAERKNIASGTPEVAGAMRARLREMIQSSLAPHAETEIHYTTEELAEVHQRLEELGYME